MSGQLWRILVVEDDAMEAGLVQVLLGQYGYVVDTAPTGAQAAELVVQRRYGAMVLDWMLPDIEGTEIARRIRAAGSRLPIVMVTARASVRDLEEALESGADDFIAKPYDMRELLVRLRAVLRRSGGTAEPVLRAGPIVVDPRSHEMFVGRIRVELTKIELRLLMLLMTNEGKPVPKAQLLAAIWGNCTNAASNLVAVHVSHLRRKLGGAGRHVRTVGGVGYRIVAELDDGSARNGREQDAADAADCSAAEQTSTRGNANPSEMTASAPARTTSCRLTRPRAAESPRRSRSRTP